MKKLLAPLVVPLLAGAALLVLVLPASARAEAGELDRSFGGTGKVTAFLEALEPREADAHRYGLPTPQVHLARAPGGRIVAAAGTTLFAYLRNGRPDRSFGEGGRLTIAPAPGSATVIVGVKFDSRGRLLVAGTVRPSPWSASGFVSRYLADGRPDPGFGSGGTVVTTLGLPAPPVPPSRDDFPPVPPSGGPTVEFLGLAVDDADRPILSGAWTGEFGICYPFVYSPRNSGFVARLGENGSVDTGFGNGGVLTDPSKEANLSPLPDEGGVLFVGVQTKCIRGPRPASDLQRATEGGQHDPSFGSGQPLSFGFGERPTLARDRFGRILALSLVESSPPILQRLTPRGTLDPRFGKKGGLRIPLEAATGQAALGVDRRGRPVIAASSQYAGDRAALLLVRRRRDGGIDRSFRDRGQVRTYFGGDALPQQVLAGDSKILVGGLVVRPGSYRIALARYDAR